MSKARLWVDCASTVALMVGAVAYSGQSRAASAGASEHVETVVVTAERRAVDLQKTTLAASVLNADDLVKKSVVNLTSLQSAVPGITINDYGSANVFNMRGVGREAVDVEIPSGVAIYRDGAPTLAGYFQNEPYYDLSGVEVLRGPQGTFAGQSASGGAVFIRSNNPDLGGFSGQLQVGVGDWSEYEAQGAANIPLDDTVAMRVAGYHLSRGSWYDLSGTYTGHPGTRDASNARLGVYWQPSASWDVLLKADIGISNFGGNPVSTPGAPLFKIQLDDPMAYVDKSIRSVLDAKYHFADGVTLRSLSGIQNISTLNNLDANGGGPTPPVDPLLQPPTNSFRSRGNFNFYSQEFNLVSPEDQRFRWVLGAFAERQVSLIPDYLTTGKDGFAFYGFFNGFGTAFPSLESPWHAVENDLALFASTQYDFTPTLTLETGLRASYNDRKQFTDFEFGFGFAPPNIPLQPADGHVQTDSGDYLDGKIALQWKPTENDFAYFTGSRGHTVKGINIFPPNNAYRPVEVWNLEGGWKSTLLDGHLRTQLNAYYESIGNYQAVFGFANGAIVNGSETRNASTRSKIWGIEASGQGNFGNLGIDFGAAYLNSKLGDFNNIINPFATDPVATPEAVAFGTNCQTGAPLVNLTGAKAPFSPELTANVGAQYAIHTGYGGWTVTPRADVSYASENQANLFACSLETIKARTLVNLQMTLDNEGSPWWASVWMTNVGDLHYVAAVQNIPPIYYAGPPRQFGLRIGRSF